MRPNLISRLLREGEEIDFEGMFNAASANIEWSEHTAMHNLWVTVRFGIFGNAYSQREIPFRIVLTNEDLLEIKSFYLAQTMNDDYGRRTSRMTNAILLGEKHNRIHLPTLKQVVEKWIYTDWCSVYLRKEGGELHAMYRLKESIVQELT